MWFCLHYRGDLGAGTPRSKELAAGYLPEVRPPLEVGYSAESQIEWWDGLVTDYCLPEITRPTRLFHPGPPRIVRWRICPKKGEPKSETVRYGSNAGVYGPGTVVWADSNRVYVRFDGDTEGNPDLIKEELRSCRCFPVSGIASSPLRDLSGQQLTPTMFRGATFSSDWRQGFSWHKVDVKILDAYPEHKEPRYKLFQWGRQFKHIRRNRGYEEKTLRRGIPNRHSVTPVEEYCRQLEEAFFLSGGTQVQINGEWKWINGEWRDEEDLTRCWNDHIAHCGVANVAFNVGKLAQRMWYYIRQNTCAIDDFAEAGISGYDECHSNISERTGWDTEGSLHHPGIIEVLRQAEREMRPADVDYALECAKEAMFYSAPQDMSLEALAAAARAENAQRAVEVSGEELIAALADCEREEGNKNRGALTLEELPELETDEASEPTAQETDTLLSPAEIDRWCKRLWSAWKIDPSCQLSAIGYGLWARKMRRHERAPQKTGTARKTECNCTTVGLRNRCEFNFRVCVGWHRTEEWRQREEHKRRDGRGHCVAWAERRRTPKFRALTAAEEAEPQRKVIEQGARKPRRGDGSPWTTPPPPKGSIWRATWRSGQDRRPAAWAGMQPDALPPVAVAHRADAPGLPRHIEDVCAALKSADGQNDEGAYQSARSALTRLLIGDGLPAELIAEEAAVEKAAHDYAEMVNGPTRGRCPIPLRGCSGCGEVNGGCEPGHSFARRHICCPLACGKRVPGRYGANGGQCARCPQLVAEHPEPSPERKAVSETWCTVSWCALPGMAQPVISGYCLKHAQWRYEKPMREVSAIPEAPAVKTCCDGSGLIHECGRPPWFERRIDGGIHDEFIESYVREGKSRPCYCHEGDWWGKHAAPPFSLDEFIPEKPLPVVLERAVVTHSKEPVQIGSMYLGYRVLKAEKVGCRVLKAKKVGYRMVKVELYEVWLYIPPDPAAEPWAVRWRRNHSFDDRIRTPFFIGPAQDERLPLYPRFRYFPENGQLAAIHQLAGDLPKVRWDMYRGFPRLRLLPGREAELQELENGLALCAGCEGCTPK